MANIKGKFSYLDVDKVIKMALTVQPLPEIMRE